MKCFLVMLLVMFITACTSKVSIDGQDVPCIGAFDDGDPDYVYSTNGWNVAMAIVFSEMLIPPVVVIVNETKCPVRKAHKDTGSTQL